MSDVVRSYTGIYSSGTLRRSRRRRSDLGRGCATIFLFLVGMVVLLFFIALWISRDSCTWRQVIPARESYHVALVNIVKERNEIAHSPVWNILPPAWQKQGGYAVLGEKLPLPEWVLNNMVGPVCLVTGNQLDGSDMLVVTRMSRVGRILEMGHRFVSGIHTDWCGGLRLRQIVGAHIYYAVRGRLLILSPSRSTLIKSLTLRPEDCISEQDLAHILKESGAEQLRGAVSLPPGTPGADWAKSVTFALRIDQAGAHLQVQAVPAEESRKKLARLLESSHPVVLEKPPAGMIGISANFNKSLRSVCAAIGAMTQAYVPWQRWLENIRKQYPAMFNQVISFADTVGPGIRLSCVGIDVTEIFPTPEIVLLADAAPEKVQALFNTLPAPPPDINPWDPYPRYDDTKKWVTVPLPGGPSIEILAASWGNALLVSSSATVGKKLLKEKPDSAPLSEPGNLYIQIDPEQCIKAWGSVGALLCKENLLRNQAEEQFKQAIQEWTQRFTGVQGVTLLARTEKGMLSADIRIQCGGTQNQ